MKKKLVIIGIFLLIVALVGFLAVKMMYKKAERNVAKENAIVVNTKDFVTLYKNFEDSANKLYLNKTVQITGIISSKTETPENKTNFIISISDSIPSIDCTIDALYKSVNVFDTITIKGICTGFLSNVLINDAILISSKKIVTPSLPSTVKDTIKKEIIATKKDSVSKKEIFKTSKAQINFDAGGGVEDIKATNNQVEASIETNGNVSFKLAMLQFKFDDVLMQQHFNEEYVESNKFPTANFAGKITNINEVSLNKDGSYKANIKGKLTLHGITKDIETVATITIKNQKVNALATLKIILANFGVKSAAADEATIKITANF